MKETTLIRNVLSLAKYQFVDVSLLEWSPKWRWKTLSSSGGITCITSRNTIVLKNDIRMFLPICLHALGMHISEQNSSKFAILAENLIISLRKLKHFLFEICRDVQVGDVATVGECRPLSKTVKFNTLKVSRAAGNKKSFKKF